MNSKNPPKIKIGKISDLDRVFEIEQKCFPGKIGYSKIQLKSLILHLDSTFLIGKQEGNIQAFIIVIYKPGSSIGRIETIDVDPNFQNRGIGLKLLKAAEKKMKLKGILYSQLEVSEGNKVAQELYKKAGYHITENIKDYYTFEHYNTYNALRMVKRLF